MTKQRLTQEQEIRLIKMYQEGGRAKEYALRKLVEFNQGLIHKVVNKFPMKNCVCTYDDLFQEGIMGFMHGVSKFDLSRGYRLSTYSFNWITAFVRRYYLNHYRTVRLPVHVTQSNTTLNKQIERLTTELGRTPTLDEICEMNGEANSIICNTLFTLSLNSLTGEDGELQDLQGYDDTDVNDTKMDVHILLDQLRGMVSPRDYTILVQRYGLDGEGERTLNELAEANEVTRARVHQVAPNIINKLSKIG